MNNLHKKFEYKILDINPSLEDLNYHGANGWEFCYRDESNGQTIYKRENEGHLIDAIKEKEAANKIIDYIDDRNEKVVPFALAWAMDNKVEFSSPLTEIINYIMLLENELKDD